MNSTSEFYSCSKCVGKITGADYRLYKNAGWNTDASPDIVATSMMHLDNSYEFPTYRVNTKTCKTNTPSNTAFRAYGAPPCYDHHQELDL